MRSISVLLALIVLFPFGAAIAQSRDGSLRDLRGVSIPDPEPPPGELIAGQTPQWAPSMDLVLRDSRSTSVAGVSYESVSPSNLWTFGGGLSTLNFDAGGDAQLVEAYAKLKIDTEGDVTSALNVSFSRLMGLENGADVFLATRWKVATQTSLISNLGVTYVAPDEGESDEDFFAKLSVRHQFDRWGLTVSHAFENDFGPTKLTLAADVGAFLIAVAERQSVTIAWTVEF
jgi:hypothetical protein